MLQYLLLWYLPLNHIAFDKRIDVLVSTCCYDKFLPSYILPVMKQRSSSKKANQRGSLGRCSNRLFELTLGPFGFTGRRR